MPPLTSQDLSSQLQRYRQKRPKSYTPLGFDVDRLEMEDPYKSFRRNMQSIDEISRAGTEVARTKSFNRAMQIRQDELARLQEVANQQIDLSNITPKFSGNMSQQEIQRIYQSSAPQGTSTTGMSKPLSSYRQTSGYGYRIDPHTRTQTKMHTGIDLAAPIGTPIYATHSGTVASAGWGGGYGNLVILQGGKGLQTYYAHQSKLNVKPGQFVQRGQVIGFVGSTGKSTGPHLHYEVRIGGRHVNPAGYL